MRELADKPSIEELQRRRAVLNRTYDYVKFHIGLYVGSPAVLTVIAHGFGVNDHPTFRVALLAILSMYVVAGLHAGYFLGQYIRNVDDDEKVDRLYRCAMSIPRRALHHWLYWGAMLFGIACILRLWHVGAP